MNIIDKNFQNLTQTIEKQTTEEIFTHIKNLYLKLPNNIKESLEKFLKNFPYWGKLNHKENIYEELYNRSLSLKRHLEDFKWFYQELEDYRSKKLLYAILNNWYNFDFETLNNSIEKNYTHYFDLDIVKCTKEEVIVDLGAYTGDTIDEYLNTYGANNYQKIYCYEITTETFQKLKNNLAPFPNIIYKQKAASNKNETLYFSPNSTDASANKISKTGIKQIETVTIDDDIKEKVTLIKMDIEGSEEDALLGCTKHIKNDEPKLLISVYHNHKDLWKIPKIVSDINPNYKFYLRNYGGNIFPTETVLLAIPKNKRN